MKALIKTLICFAAVIITGAVNQQVLGQDTIVNNEVIVAKVLEVNPTQIKYNRFDLPNGPVFILNRYEVATIIYSNGSAEIITKKATPEPEVITNEPTKKFIDKRATDFGHHFFYFSVTDLVLKLISGGYEYTLPNGKFSIGIPVSFGMADMGIGNFDSSYTRNGFHFGRLPGISPNKIYSTGMSFRYYIRGQGTVRYFVGPTIEYGEFYDFEEIYDYITYEYSYLRKKETYGGVILNNGVLFQPLKNLNINALVGLVIIQRSDRNYNNNFPFYYDQNYGIQGSINVGFKF